jgi:hypothetical protein
MSVVLHGKQAQESSVLIDTTAQEKNITYPTDAKLAIKIINRLNKLVDLMITFNFRNVIVKPTRLNNLLDPIIIFDTMTPLYSDVSYSFRWNTLLSYVKI